MKKSKLKLREIGVSSFVTSLSRPHQNTYKGGVTEGCGQSFDACKSVPVNACNVASYNGPCPTIPVAECEVPSVNLQTVCRATDITQYLP
jgi:hypothetical protein